jgi:hypothetical protein
MKTFRLLSFALLAVFLTAGCGTLEVASGSNPERVLNGAISAGAALPAGTEIVVRLLAPPMNNDASRTPTNDIPVIARPTTPHVERVLGEQAQTLTAGTIDPVPFRLAYYADDALLRRGLSLEVRISFGGRLRFRTINAHVVTLTSAQYKQDVSVQPVER